MVGDEKLPWPFTDPSHPKRSSLRWTLRVMSRIPSPWNTARTVGLLGDEEFVDALTSVEDIVDEAEQTLGRVER
jgi:hypothetical protein